MDEEEAKLDEIWSDLDTETRERAIALFLEMAYRVVITQKSKPDDDSDVNNNGNNESK